MQRGGGGFRGAPRGGGRGYGDRGGRGGGYGGGNYGGGPQVDRNCQMPQSIPAQSLVQAVAPGKAGKPIDLITNFYKFQTQDLQVFQYEIDISVVDQPRAPSNPPAGDVAPRPPRKEVSADDAKDRLQKFLRRHSSDLVRKFVGARKDIFRSDEIYAFDESKMIFFRRDVGDANLNAVVDHDCNGRIKKFSLTLTKVNTLELGDVMRYYAKKMADIPENIIILYEIVFRDIMNKNYTSFQSKCFDLSTMHGKPGMDDVQFVHGFKSSVLQTQAGLALNLHLKTACVLAGRFKTVFDLFQLKVRPEAPRNMDTLKPINELLRHLEVRTDYGGFQRDYKIDAIVMKTPSQVQLDDTKTVAQYYMEKYKIPVNPNLPLVRIMSQKATYLPMELCNIKPNQFLSNQKINPIIQRELLMKSTNTPNVYFTKLNQIIEKISNEQNTLLQKQFGITLETKPMQVKGRVLPTPNQQGKGRNDRLVKPTAVQKFSVFCLDREVGKKELEGFATEMKRTGDRLGMKLVPDQVVVTELTNMIGLKTFCQNLGQRLKNQIILVGIPKFGKGELRPGVIYNTVKFYSEQFFGFTTQCFKAEFVRDMPRGYFDNFLLKVNGKYGGLNQTLESSAFTNMGFDAAETMMVAYDVNHPALAEASGESVVGLVGSVDPMFSRFLSSITTQRKMREEVVVGLHDSLLKMLGSYKEINKRYPKTMIVFRDGVAEGQFNSICRIELEAINKLLASIGVTIKIVFIVVQKIHSGRFAMITPDTSGRNPSYNVPSGTVVDTGIVSSKYPNFYLNSHFSPLGTSKPTHYYVLRNDPGMNMDQLQNFVFRSCFNCVRTRLAISIPLAVRYADLLAYRGKMYLESISSNMDPQVRGARPGDLISKVSDFGFNPFYV